MGGTTRSAHSRRQWLRRAAIPVSAFALGAAPCGALAAPAWKPALTNAAEKSFRGALGKRRGGFALVALGSNSPVFTPRPANSGDALLDAANTLWRPGSTVKPFVLELLAQKKLIGPSSENRCKGRLRVDDRILDCSHPPQPGAMIASEALALSCNEFFVHFAVRLPTGACASALREAGFAHRQPFGLEAAPALVETDIRPEAHLLQCLGEQGVVTSPLALLRAFQQLVERMEAHSRSITTGMLRDGMRGCVEYGSGVEAQVRGLPVAGKTGTGSARGRTHQNGWFLSYAPADTPLYAMVTFVEHGSGGAQAAPAAAAVWQALGEQRAFG